jgi:hypothetical protein
MRDTQLVLLATGGAELTEVESDTVIWASDSDEDFAEEFPDILDENDIEHLQDYLEEKKLLTPRELEVMEIMTEPLGSDEDEDEDDDDEDEQWDTRPDADDDDEDDIIEGDFEER